VIHGRRISTRGPASQGSKDALDRTVGIASETAGREKDDRAVRRKQGCGVSAKDRRPRRPATAVSSETAAADVHTAPVPGASSCWCWAAAAAADGDGETAQRESPLRRLQRGLAGRSRPSLLRPSREGAGQQSRRKTGENVHGASAQFYCVFLLTRSDPRPNECDQARMQVPAPRWSCLLRGN